ncbi:protein MAINTENANCE OF MERISTEMS-like [Papaver somniferum]|uniref:protein MAINTENANCE OF MERISTEMS-like n=1 Tax=Papaver somniferum TaxID=3469 RepID=UPI000E6FF699|nr:protein MAINTENANCE OF MERISTEMS-like [Papaver somniferum]
MEENMGLGNQYLFPNHYDELKRVFVLWKLGKCLFTNASSVVLIGFLEALEDLQQAPTYDWGSVILSEIYMNLIDCSTCVRDRFDAFWGLLEYWWYTWFRVSEPSIKNHTNVFPIIRKYDSENWKPIQIEDGQHTAIVHKIQQLSITSRKFISQPYEAIPEFEEEQAQRMLQLSLTRIVLYNPISQKGVWYYGERQLLQLQRRSVISVNPYQRSEVSEDDYLKLLREDHHWQEADQLIQEPTDRNDYLFWFDTIFKSNIAMQPQILGRVDFPALGRIALADELT